MILHPRERTVLANGARSLAAAGWQIAAGLVARAAYETFQRGRPHK